MAELPMVGDRVVCAGRGGGLRVLDVSNPWPQGDTRYRCETEGGEPVTLLSGDFLPGETGEPPCWVEEG